MYDCKISISASRRNTIIAWLVRKPEATFIGRSPTVRLRFFSEASLSWRCQRAHQQRPFQTPCRHVNASVANPTNASLQPVSDGPQNPYSSYRREGVLPGPGYRWNGHRPRRQAQRRHNMCAHCYRRERSFALYAFWRQIHDSCKSSTTTIDVQAIDPHSAAGVRQGILHHSDDRRGFAPIYTNLHWRPMFRLVLHRFRKKYSIVRFGILHFDFIEFRE